MKICPVGAQFFHTDRRTDRHDKATCYNKTYQQMRLFVLCLYFLFLVFSLHVSGFQEPIIRGIFKLLFLCYHLVHAVLR